MYTQCPECLTIYEIDEDALQASLGIVRCGRCDKRFDALRTLSDTLPIEPLAGLPEQDPAERAPTLTEAVPPSTIERAAKKSRPEGSAPASTSPQTAEPQTSEPPPAVEPQAGDGADWFADIESELTGTSIAGARDISELRDAPDAPDGPPTPDSDDDNWSVELPEEIGIDVAAREAGDVDDSIVEEAESVLPASSSEADAETFPAPPPQATDFDLPDPLDSAPGEIEAEADEPVADFDEFDEFAEEGDGGDASLLTDTLIEPLPVDDAETEATVAPAPVYVPPRRRFSRASAVWSLGCVLLALLLATQLAWADRAELFRNPATGAWMARLCRVVPCDLPLIRDTAKLELLSRDVRPDPHSAGALTITATVRNNAVFRQPWPVVVVELNDLDNNPVAMRRFRPVEYMTDPARRAAGIAPGAIAVVAFEVADPGRRAVAFQFGFE